MCDLASPMVKLLAPATGTAALFWFMDLTAGFWGPDCDAGWAKAKVVQSPTAAAVKSVRRIVFLLIFVGAYAPRHLTPCRDAGSARGPNSRRAKAHAPS